MCVASEFLHFYNIHKGLTKQMYTDNDTRRAVSTANFFLIRAVDHIDRLMGPGYAKRNPALVIAMLNAASGELTGHHVPAPTSTTNS